MLSRLQRSTRVSALLVAAVLGQLAGAAPAAAQAPEQAAMQAQRLHSGERIPLDGRLDHPAWQRAVPHERFVEHMPRHGEAAVRRTQVRLLFDEQALYVGVLAFDAERDAIRRPLVRHDNVNRTQDFVVVYIDAIGSRRSAQFFRVNAAGSLADGIHTASDDSEDFAPDFDWDAAVADHPEGWSVVLRLPFASLRFAPGEVQPWRIMVARRLPRQDFHLLTSVMLPREASSFIDALQPIDGIRLPSSLSFFTLRPSLTVKSRRERADDGTRRSGSDIDATLDVKWRPRAESVIDATLNPDFSQVALDVPQLSGNSRFALFFAEKRPFFTESADLWRSPTDAVYTRSFTEPRWGLRSTWRGSALAGSAIVVDDRGGGLVLLPGPYATGFADQPGSRTLLTRGRYDFGPVQLGAVVAARRYEQDRGDNQVLGPDLQWSFAGYWRLQAQWLHARSTARADVAGAQGRMVRGEAIDGDRLYLKLLRNAPFSESSLTLEDIGSGFRHDSGFVAQNAIRKAAWFEGRGWRAVGPFHEFWLNLNLTRTQTRDGGETIEQQVYPGFWASGSSNLEWTGELHLLAQARASAGGPLLPQRYVVTGLVYTPSRWFPLLDSKLTVGRLIDTYGQKIRPGLKWVSTAKLRPLAALEVEPTWSLFALRGEGRRAYDERQLNLLAVWHLSPRSHLRLIVQRLSLARAADGQPAERLDRQRTGSLTYSWRASTGTVLYVGASRERSGLLGKARGSEGFVKLQVDFDDARSRLQL